MAKLFKGAEVCAALNETLKADVAKLTTRDIIPTLAIIRVGEREDDIAYEKGAVKRCTTLGVQVKNIVLSGDVAQNCLIDRIHEINEDASIHGLLLLRPLPKHMDDDAVRDSILPQKDMDGITDGSLAGVFAGIDKGYPPCTASACMEILDFYGIDLKSKSVVVIGRSLVIGKPVAMMLLGRHATVTICHTRTVDMPAVCKNADVLIVAAGRADVVDDRFVKPGQIVLDVGINMSPDGKLCGDVRFESVEPIVEAITPVPGGVGMVTTSVLAKHVIEAAKKTLS